MSHEDRGYRRRDMGGWHLRIVQDRFVAVSYLARVWGPRLPSSLYRWLIEGADDTTFRLTGCVVEPEIWMNAATSPSQQQDHE